MSHPFAAAVRRLPRSTWLLIALAAAAVGVEGVYAIAKRTNDYSVHLRYGLRFLQGRPYDTPGTLTFYPLGRSWIDAGFASVEYYAGRSLCYSAALVSLGVTLLIWRRLSAAIAPLPAGKETAAVGWTLFVLAAILIRDLDECGLQLLLLFFLSAAAYAHAHGRHALSGFWLGTAIVYKATPLLFLPLLVWKREWRTAGWTAIFAAAMSLLPATYLGWDGMLTAQGQWLAEVRDILGRQDAYPSIPGVELPKQQNVSLRAALARYVEAHPPGHLLHIDHPLFFQPGRLSPRHAKLAVTSLTLLIGAAVAWRMRRRWTFGGNAVSADFAPEWATACLFVALMSPICWRQHLVMAIPCVYLVARERLHPRAVGGLRKWFPIAAGAFLLLCHRELLGAEFAHLLVSYKFVTFAMLGYCALALTLPRRSDALAAVTPVSPSQAIAA